MKLLTNNEHKLFFNKHTKTTLIENLNKVTDESLAKFGVTREEIQEAISTGVYRGKHLVMAVIMLITMKEAIIPGYAYEDIPHPQLISQKGEMGSQNYHLDVEFVNEEDFPKEVVKIIEDKLGKKIKNITYGDLNEITGLSVVEKTGIKDLDFIKYMPNLKSLYIQSFSLNNIEALRNSNIENITFRYSSISNNDLQYLPESLKSLDLDYCYYITNLAMLTDFCRGLEEINIDCAPSLRFLNYLSTMPNLKKIYLNEVANVTEELRNIYNQKGIKNNITDDMIAQNAELDKIISEIITADMSDQEKVSAIVSYVMENLDYRLTKVFDSNESPLTSALNGKGVCATYAYFTSILLTKAGIESYDVMSSSHAWNIIKIDGKYYYADPTNITQIPFASKFIEHFDKGFYYMQDPFATFLSVMKDADSEKIMMSDELLLEIMASENEKDFGEKYLSNMPVNMIAAIGILIALGTLGRFLSDILRR